VGGSGSGTIETGSANLTSTVEVSSMTGYACLSTTSTALDDD
jgi:hypothetical protein